MNEYKPTKRKATGGDSSGFPSYSVINLSSEMSGAEDHSRTDTGSPPPVFKFDAGRITSSHDIPSMSFRSPQ